MKNRLIPLFLMNAILISSCTSSKKDVAIFIYNQEDTFISSLGDSMKEVLERKGFSYSLDFASNSQIQQNESLIDVIDNGKAKMLFVNPVDRMSAGAIIDKISNKEIPVVFFNRQPLDVDIQRGRVNNNRIFYVGTNSEAEGQSQAEMIANLFGNPDSLNSEYDKNGDGKIQIVLLKGEIGHQDSENRSKGLLEGLKAKGYHTDILSSSYCNWSRAESRVRMKEIMDNYGAGIEVVAAANDDMALGAIDYLILDRKENKESSGLPFPFFGVDGTLVGLKYIEKGYLTGTVMNEASSQAEACVRIMEDLLTYGKISDDFPYPMENEYTVYVKGKTIMKTNDDTLKSSAQK